MYVKITCTQILEKRTTNDEKKKIVVLMKNVSYYVKIHNTVALQ